MSVAEWDGVPLTDVLSRLRARRRRDGGARERRRSRRALIHGLDRRGELGDSAVIARSSRRIPRRAHERRAAAARSRPAGTARRARLVRLRVDQVGQRDSPGRRRRARDQPDEGVRRPHPSDGAPRSCARLHRRRRIRPPPIPSASRRRRTAAGIEYRIVGIVWGGDGPSIAWRSALAPMVRGRRFRSVPLRPRLPRGRSGSSAGSRRDRASTPSSCASPIRLFRSAASMRATTCGK